MQIIFIKISKTMSGSNAHGHSSSLSDRPLIFFLLQPTRSSTFPAFQAILEYVDAWFVPNISTKSSCRKYLNSSTASPILYSIFKSCFVLSEDFLKLTALRFSVPTDTKWPFRIRSFQPNDGCDATGTETPVVSFNVCHLVALIRCSSFL